MNLKKDVELFLPIVTKITELEFTNRRQEQAIRRLLSFVNKVEKNSEQAVKGTLLWETKGHVAKLRRDLKNLLKFNNLEAES